MSAERIQGLEQSDMDRLADRLSEDMMNNVTIMNAGHDYAFAKLGIDPNDSAACEEHLTEIHNHVAEFHNILLAHTLATNYASLLIQPKKKA